MSNDKAHHPERPYEIRERLAQFAELVVRAAQKAQGRSAIAAALCPNLVRAAVSAAANGEEADDTCSPRDFLSKQRIALREVKETRLRLRVLRASGYLQADDHWLIEEAVELTKIMAAIIRNRSQGKSQS